MRLQADVLLERRRLIEWLFEPVLGLANGYESGCSLSSGAAASDGMNSRFGAWGGLRLGFGSSRVPVILQTEAAECGLACLAMVAAAHGHRTDLPTLRQRFSLSLKGVTLARPGAHGRELQLHARALRAEIEDLAQLQHALHPALGPEPLRGAGRQ